MYPCKKFNCEIRRYVFFRNLSMLFFLHIVVWECFFLQCEVASWYLQYIALAKEAEPELTEYLVWILIARDGNIGKCHPRKPSSILASPPLTLVFSVWQLPMVPSRAGSIHNIMLITLCLVSNQTKSSEYFSLLSYFKYPNVHIRTVRIYGKPYAYKFCAFNNTVFIQYHPWPS